MGHALHLRTLRRLLAVLILTGAVGATAQDFERDVTAVGTSAASFLEIGVGARAMALGGTYTAIANDPTALYYNPAGIAWARGVQAEVAHNEWLVDTDHDFVGLVVPVGTAGSVGLSVISLDYGDQPVRTIARPEGTGQTYGARDLALAATWGLALTDRFAFGLTGKWVNQRVWNESGNTLAMDVGILYHTGLDGLAIGFSMSNFGTELGLSGRDLASTVDPDAENSNIDRVPVSFDADSYPLPVLFRAGIAYERPLPAGQSLLLTSDLSHPSHAPEHVNVGVEYGIGGLLYLRAGWQRLAEGDTEGGATYGAGIDWYRVGQVGLRVDYVYSDWGALQNAQRISVGLSFE
jgi:hypothetical protein